MANPHDHSTALKHLQDSIHRDKILHARAMTPQVRIESVFELSECQFGMMRARATFASIARLLFADDALAAPVGLCDLDPGLSGLLHLGDHFTVFRTEVMAFVVHSRFVAKPDQTNRRL